MPKNVQITIQLHSFHMLANYAQNPSSYASAEREPRISDVEAGFRKGRGTTADPISAGNRKSKGI